MAGYAMLGRYLCRIAGCLDRSVLRHARALRQGRRLCRTGAGRTVHPENQRQLLGYHGLAAVRNRTAAESGRHPPALIAKPALKTIHSKARPIVPNIRRRLWNECEDKASA